MAVVEFPADGAGRVFVEALVTGASGDDVGLSRAGSGERAAQAVVRTWEQALDGMRLAAEGALTQLRRIDPPPEEVKVSFGVAVDAKLGATLVSAGANAHLMVEVTWKAEPGATAAGSAAAG